MNVHPDLLDAARRGDRKAQYDLYRVCYPMLMAIGMRYRRDQQEAVSAVNQGYLKLIQHLDQFQAGEAPFSAWARRVMINSVIDAFRREKKWRETMTFPEELTQTSDRDHIAWNEADQNLDAQYLENLLRRLPAATQQVFNLFAIDGFSHREIGEMTGISEGTSKWHVNQARQQLQAWIKQETHYGKYR